MLDLCVSPLTDTAKSIFLCLLTPGSKASGDFPHRDSIPFAHHFSFFWAIVLLLNACENQEEIFLKASVLPLTSGVSNVRGGSEHIFIFKSFMRGLKCIVWFENNCSKPYFPSHLMLFSFVLFSPGLIRNRKISTVLLHSKVLILVSH